MVSVSEEMDFQSTKVVEVDELKLRFLRNDNRQGIPILLTSPWPESLCAFAPIWPALAPAQRRTDANY